MQDVRIVQALCESAEAGKVVQILLFAPSTQPGVHQQIDRSPVREADLVHVKPPSR